ncbi:hypothetical protein RchiOBHm_Chr6g0257901 [Rosa chinensis]|uniref:Uncharacterized protein n=1 Tax=Rosa chinensis TaxID=74649 RepID=A0A2P6PMG6_ROSCH|nr:hypothetical protein RchiOBHm_Chr6g0257901 [Rosa chinensis]
MTSGEAHLSDYWPSPLPPQPSSSSSPSLSSSLPQPDTPLISATWVPIRVLLDWDPQEGWCWL